MQLNILSTAHSLPHYSNKNETIWFLQHPPMPNSQQQATVRAKRKRPLFFFQNKKTTAKQTTIPHSIAPHRCPEFGFHFACALADVEAHSAATCKSKVFRKQFEQMSSRMAMDKPLAAPPFKRE
jgi:hypothetical protein